MAIMHKTLVYIIILCFFLTSIAAMNLTADETSTQMDYLSLGNGKYSRSIQNDRWPMFLGEPARTGNSSATGPEYYHQLWSTATGVWWGSPVVMYDQIYLCTNTATNCYNMTGGLVWSFNAGSRYSTPCVYDGRVYVSSGAGQLYCLDANATGAGSTTNYWTYRPSGVTQARSSPVTDGKRIYYATYHISGLHAVWINNGTKVWNSSLGGSRSIEASPAYWNGRVYCGGGESYDSGTNNLHCFNATNGAEFWRFKTGDDVVSTPAIAYGRVFFGSMDSKVYCVDALGANGTTTKYWDYNTTAGTTGIYGSAAVGYDKVYIGSTNGNLYCFSPYGTGGSTTMHWSQSITPLGNWGICGSPAITKDYVFITNSNNAIHCRNRTTGALVWTERISPYGMYGMSSSPAVYKDSLFIASDNGNLYALGLDKISPKVTSSNPIDNEDDIEMDQNISVIFDEELDTSTLTTANFELMDSNSTTVSGDVSWNMGIKTVYFSPDQHLKKAETYTFTVKTGVADIRGNNLDGNGNGIFEGPGVDEFNISFKTIPHYRPKIGLLMFPELTEEVPYSTNISSAITDDDTPKSSLILTEDSDYATLDGYVISFYYPEGVTSDLINITVSDGLFTTWREVPIKIKPVNDLPVISSIPTAVVNEDETFTVQMTEYVTDVDTEINNLNLYVFSNNYSSKLGYVKKDGLSINLTYPNGISSDVVNVTVYEGNLNDGQSATTEFLVQVMPVNDKPELDEPLDELEMKEDEVDNSITLNSWFLDIDDTELTYKASGQNNIDVMINTAGEVTLTPTENWHGIENITFTATDSGGEEVSSMITVIVESVNDLPVIEQITSPNEGDTFEYDQEIEFDTIVTDVDLDYGDTLSYYWESDETGAIGYDKKVTGIILDSGKHNIRLTVTDSESASVWSEVTIMIEDKPVVDTDNDGTPDNLDKDDDNDNIPDTWELKYPTILDPLDPSDAQNDSDDDGYTNLQEYLGADGVAGGNDASNPTSQSSIPKKEKSGGDDDNSSDSSMMIIIVIVVVIIIVVLVLFMMMNKRKKESETAGEDQIQMPPQQIMPQQTDMDTNMGMVVGGGVGGVGVQPYQDPVMQGQQYQYQMYDQSQMMMPPMPPGQEMGNMQQQLQYPQQEQVQGQQVQEQGQQVQEQGQQVQDQMYTGDTETTNNLTEEGATEIGDESADSDLLQSAPMFSLPAPESDLNQTIEVKKNEEEEDN